MMPDDRVLGRAAMDAIREAMADTPVLLLLGARQCGKSTLALQAAELWKANVVTLDDADVLRFAEQDPAGFLRSVAPVDRDGYGRAVIDEIQKAPGLFPAIKATVDRHRFPGRFLLTGSANVLSLPKLAESLAGRMEPIDLFPFSQGELEGRRDGFVDAVFQEDPASWDVTPADDIFARVEAGGFPEASRLRQGGRRRHWFQAYLRTMVERDIRDLSHIERSTQMHRVLGLLALRVGSTMNKAALAGDAGMPYSTLERYIGLLEAVFLVHSVPAWWTNSSSRLAKAPKPYLCDSGLLAAILGLDAAALQRDRNRFGAVLENFVFQELLKQCRWSQVRPELSFFRTARQLEVDFVLEDAQRRVIGIEVKAAASVQESDLRGLAHLRELAGDRFVRGIVLNLGERVTPVARDVLAMPVSALWQVGAKPL